METLRVIYGTNDKAGGPGVEIPAVGTVKNAEVEDWSGDIGTILKGGNARVKSKERQ